MSVRNLTLQVLIDRVVRQMGSSQNRKGNLGIVGSNKVLNVFILKKFLSVVIGREGQDSEALLAKLLL